MADVQTKIACGGVQVRPGHLDARGDEVEVVPLQVGRLEGLPLPAAGLVGGLAAEPRHALARMLKVPLAIGDATTLTEAGYRHVGMDHFARPDDALCRAQDAGRGAQEAGSGEPA